MTNHQHNELILCFFCSKIVFTTIENNSNRTKRLSVNQKQIIFISVWHWLSTLILLCFSISTNFVSCQMEYKNVSRTFWYQFIFINFIIYFSPNEIFGRCDDIVHNEIHTTKVRGTMKRINATVKQHGPEQTEGLCQREHS